MSEQWLIDTLKSRTGYRDIRYAQDSQVDLLNSHNIDPIILVGHLGIQLQNPEDYIADGFHEIENSEILTTAIQFICRREILSEVRDKVKYGYSNQSPFGNDSNYSSLLFLRAEVVAKTNTKIWWSEVIGLIMPRVS